MASLEMNRGITINRFGGVAQHSTPGKLRSVTIGNRGLRPCVTLLWEATPMAEHVCPWWIGYLLVSPIRRWIQNPDELIAPYVTPGMTVLEPGPGMGFFTLPLARRVGSGRVIAADIQPKMLAALQRRATKAGLMQRIEMRLAKADSLVIDDLRGTVDFVLAVAVVHEMPSAEGFFREVAGAMAPGARLLLVEPAGHVTDAIFARELERARGAGLAITDQPAVKRCHAAVLAKEAA